jgi:carbon-monoxide dehydrogenase large subunit
MSSAAASNPNVIDVITPVVVKDACRSIPCVWVKPGQRQIDYPVVPTDRTRYVGEALGLVVARSPTAAQDALGLIEVDIDPIAAAVDAHEAAAAGAPLLNPEWGTNIAIESDFGTPGDSVRAAIMRAPRVVSMRFHIPRQCGCPMEARGLLARWDGATQELTVWTSTQTPHHVRDHLARVLKIGIDQVRVIAPDIGGGFGCKEHLYPDEVLVCLATMRLGVPVKWIESRQESFTATTHARDQFHDARLAFDDDGRFIALHSEILMDLGAHPSNVGSGPGHVASIMLQGPYRFDVAGTHLRCVVTNKTPVGAYRGFGMQQATWVRERLVDEAARSIGLDAAEIRRRNMIRRDELPFTTHFFQRYDSGDYIKAMDAVVAELGNPIQQHDGKRRGLGLSSYVEFTGLGPSAIQKIVGFHLSGYESAVVRVEADGTATVSSGVVSMGQGIETTLAQLAGDRLGLSMDKIKVVLGDSALAPYSGSGSIASRSMTVGGGATVAASERLRRKILTIAAHKLEAAEEDLVLGEGRAWVRGVPDRGVSIAEIATSAWLAWDLPNGLEPGLEEKEMYDPIGVSYSYATHGALVAVDMETGLIEIEKYVVAHDCGVVVNPMIVDGQIEGGVAQGVGAALMEQFVYDNSGQPRTTTFLDYMIPSSGEVPNVVHEHFEIPSPFTPGGMKGMGEGGAIAPPAAIGNALCNALPEIAHLVTDLPFTPTRVWSWLQEIALDRT